MVLYVLRSPESGEGERHKEDVEAKVLPYVNCD